MLSSLHLKYKIFIQLCLHHGTDDGAKINPLSPQQGLLRLLSISRDKPRAPGGLADLLTSMAWGQAWPTATGSCLTSAPGRREALTGCSQRNGKQWWEFTDQMVAFHPQLCASLLCQPQNFSPAQAHLGIINLCFFSPYPGGKKSQKKSKQQTAHAGKPLTSGTKLHWPPAEG